MKQCSQCKQIKPISEFYVWPSCKKCATKSTMKYLQSEKGKLNRQHYKKSKKYKENQRKGAAQHRQRYPERIKARKIVSYAIKTGTLLHPSVFTCKCCLNKAAQYHHSLGYEPEHWFDVIPVCRKCHHKLDYVG